MAHATATAVKLVKAMEAQQADIAAIRADVAAIRAHLGLSSGPANDVDGAIAARVESRPPPAKHIAATFTKSPTR